MVRVHDRVAGIAHDNNSRDYMSRYEITTNIGDTDMSY